MLLICGSFLLTEVQLLRFSWRWIYSINRGQNENNWKIVLIVTSFIKIVFTAPSWLIELKSDQILLSSFWSVFQPFLSINFNILYLSGLSKTKRWKTNYLLDGLLCLKWTTEGIALCRQSHWWIDISGRAMCLLFEMIRFLNMWFCRI